MKHGQARRGTERQGKKWHGMARKTPLKRKTRLRRMNIETERNVRAYLIFKNHYLHNHPYCEIEETCFKPAAHVHHLKGHGRHGSRLCDERFVRAACIEHHRHIHDHAKESREKKLLLDQ